MPSAVDHFPEARPVRRSTGLRVERARPPGLCAATGFPAFQSRRARAVEGAQ